MRTFHLLLINTVLASITNNFVWFAFVFWAYLQTQSVITTAVVGGLFSLIAGLGSFVFGSFVDHHHKKWVMMFSSTVSLGGFCVAGVVYALTPTPVLLDFFSPAFWGFALAILIGSVADRMRGIAMSTCVTLLVPEDRHDKANGLLGSAMGVTMIITSLLSGLAVGYAGMGFVIVVTIIATIMLMLQLMTITVHEELVTHGTPPSLTDIRGTLRIIAQVPGLLALIVFATFNNFLGGVFMALMDAYGLSLMSVQAWGGLFGICSTAFVVGGILVAKRGLGSRPLRVLFVSNIIVWTICIFFTIQESILLLAVGMYGWMLFFPIIEACEQTIMQKVVPYAWQGRVFGLGQSIENLVSPVSSIAIGPIAQYIVVPYMTVGYEAQAIGSWYGVGADRAYALIFSVAGLIGLIVTLVAFYSSSYRRLTHSYTRPS